MSAPTPHHRTQTSSPLFLSLLLLHVVLLSLLSVPATAGNPFRGRRQYVLHYFHRQVRLSLASATPRERPVIRPLLNVSTAMWLADRTMLTPWPGHNPRNSFAGALRDSLQTSRRTGTPAKLVTAVLYNLPNRDCAAYASTGGICCQRRPGHHGGCDLTANSHCTDGLQRYRSTYVNIIAGLARRYCGRVPMAFIIEPDALPNLVTNTANPRCGSLSTQTAYRRGIIYAVKTLNQACRPSPLYVHAAAGNWLGWRSNAAGFAKLVRELGIAPLIRGFAINVSGYQTIGRPCPPMHGVCAMFDHPCCRFDPCGLAKQWNEGFNEANYVQLLRNVFAATIPNFNPRFVIDTARAGGPAAPRVDCANWCNVRHARVGPRPTARTGLENVDAFLWIKPPTESDGCTRVLPNGRMCSRFDSVCESVDSLGGRPNEPRAPDAGVFFDAHFKKMIGASR